MRGMSSLSSTTIAIPATIRVSPMLSRTMTCSIHTDCKLPVDVVLQCSEGTFLGAHSEFLNVYSLKFKTLLSPTLPTEPIAVKERAEVITQMLLFMHPGNGGTSPKLDELPSSIVVDLAEVVEKWKVVTAQEACRLAMSSLTDALPVHVLLYAKNYGHHEMMEKAAKKAVSMDIETVAAIIASRGSGSLDVFMAWARYRDVILTALNEVRRRCPDQHCGSWKDWFYKHSNNDLINLLPRLPSEEEMYGIMERHRKHIVKCSDCLKAYDEWKNAIGKEVYQCDKYRFVHYL